MRRALSLLFLLALTAPLACNDLPEVPAIGCGNRVIDEAMEDCDGPTALGTCGEPGVPGACRFLCDRKGTAPRGGCPEAFACGVDGLCRQPTAALLSTGTSSQVLAADLRVGDIDLDGRADLLALSQSTSGGAAPARVLHFGDGGLPAATVLLPGEVLQPEILPLSSASATSAILSNSIAGLSTILGQSGRSFVSKNYSSLPLGAEVRTLLGLAIDAIPSSQGAFGDEIILFARVELPGQAPFNVLGNSDGSSVNPMILLDSHPDTLLGRLQKGHLLWPQGPDHFCPSVVLPFQDATELLLLTPCVHEPDGAVRWLSVGEGGLTKIAIPKGGKINSQAFLVDIDRDGLLDVVMDVAEASGNTALHAAYGTGLGYMVPRPGATEQNTTGRLLIPAPPPGEPAPPDQFISVYSLLAVGHLDGDNALDFVTAYNAYTSLDTSGLSDFSSEIISQGGQTYAPVFPTFFNGYWSEARLCDLNDDGRTDVVGARDSVSLDVLLNDGEGGFRNGSIPLNGVPGALGVADFDGDLLDDVVFRERSYDDNGAIDDTLTVLFGARQGLPSELVRMGRFGEILATVPSRVYNPFSPDFTADMGLFSRSDDQITASQFFGSSDRRLRSYLALQSTSSDGQGQPAIDIDAPLGLTPARFAAGAAPGLVALGTSRFSVIGPELGKESESEDLRLRLWRLDPKEDASFSDLRHSIIPGVTETENVLTSGDLDGDGVDEIILLLSSFGGPILGPAVPGGAPDPATPTSKALVFKVEAAEAPADPFRLVTSTTVAVPLSIDSKAQLSDLDGDGLPELLLFNKRPDFFFSEDGTSSSGSEPGNPETPETPDTPGEGDAGFGALWIIRQSSPGELNWAQPQRLSLPDAQRQVTGFCVLPSSSVIPRLVVSTREGLFAGLRDGDSYRFEPLLDSFGSPRTDIETLACGDFDGDGVQDVALSYGDSIEILRGIPRRPLPDPAATTMRSSCLPSNLDRRKTSPPAPCPSMGKGKRAFRAEARWG